MKGESHTIVKEWANIVSELGHRNTLLTMDNYTFIASNISMINYPQKWPKLGIGGVSTTRGLGKLLFIILYIYDNKVGRKMVRSNANECLRNGV